LYIFFFNHSPTTIIYTLSLHDALPIYDSTERLLNRFYPFSLPLAIEPFVPQESNKTLLNERLNIMTTQILNASKTLRNRARVIRSEEHTSELQSLAYLVCRLLLEKKKK